MEFELQEIHTEQAVYMAEADAESLILLLTTGLTFAMSEHTPGVIIIGTDTDLLVILVSQENLK